MSNVSWQALNDRFKTAELFGKLANIFADLPTKNIDDTLNTSAYDINDELGTDLSPETEISVKRNYEGSYLVNFPNEKTRKAIDDLQKPAETADDAETESVLSFDDITKTFVTYLPTFVYYSNYGNLTSRIYLPNAINWLMSIY